MRRAVLERIDWHRLAQMLLEEDTQDARGSRDPALQSAVIITGHPTSAWHALWFCAPWQRISELAELHRWLYATARDYLMFHEIDAGTMRRAMIQVDHRPATPGLHVCPTLQDLPLLELAAEAAAIQPSGRLILITNKHQVAAGIYTCTERASVISIDVDISWPKRDDVFAHELAHALDPRTTSTGSASEWFAELLAEMLLGQRPQTLAAAQPLIDRVLDLTSSVAACTGPDQLDRVTSAMFFASALRAAPTSAAALAG